MLVLLGLVMLGSASANLGINRAGDSYYFLKHQLLYGLLPGIIGLLICSKIYYGIYERLALPILIGSIGLLLLLFTPLGVTSGGALRWLAIGPIMFQPAELVKMGIIIYFAAWLAGAKERQESAIKGLLPFLCIMIILGGILLKQSSTSFFALLLLIACAIYFASGVRGTYIVGLLLLAIMGLAVVSYATPYRWTRIMTYLHPENNGETSGYHINQALNAIGSGGLTGVGLGQSTTKIRYLPEPMTDSLFAIIGEELGFIGSMLVIILFGTLVVRILLIAGKTTNRFGKLMLVGIGSLFGLQVFVHIGAISGLLPLTGVPLPFMSYGGTALATQLTATGILINIANHRR
jgi:cell division protein FtsW